MPKEVQSNRVCPFCKNENNFREHTFMENVRGLGSFAAAFFTKSTKDKVKTASDLAAPSGTFLNYVCLSCDGQVMQCGGCKKMLPYEDIIAKCPHCGYR